MPDGKPLFIPLMAEHFEAFAAGTKWEEFRLHGPRWNAQTCTIGRAAVLSLGYGKRRRMRGTVAGFRLVGPDASPALPTLYPGETEFAAILIVGLEPQFPNGEASDGRPAWLIPTEPGAGPMRCPACKGKGGSTSGPDYEWDECFVCKEAGTVTRARLDKMWTESQEEDRRIEALMAEEEDEPDDGLVLEGMDDA